MSAIAQIPAERQLVHLEAVRSLFGSNSPVPLSSYLKPEENVEIGKSWLDKRNVAAKNRVCAAVGCSAEGQ